MKALRKTLTILVVLIMALTILVMSSCGGNDTQSSDETQSADTSSSTTTETGNKDPEDDNSLDEYGGTKTLKYSLTSDKEAYVVSGLKNENYTDIVVPAEYKGKPVISVGDDAFFNSKNITSVTLPNTITSIGKDAFYDCYSLRSINIPQGVETIGNSAFSYCYNLTSIVIPASVTEIGRWAFDCCYRLVEVYNLSSVDLADDSWENNRGLNQYVLDMYTSLDEKSKLTITDNDYVFYDDGEVCYLIGYLGTDKELTLPESYNGKSYKINKYAFANSEITGAVISSGVTEIGRSAFFDCGNLMSVTIGENVTEILSGAFSGCKILVEVYNLSSLDIAGAEESWENGDIMQNVLVLHTSASEKSCLFITDDGYAFLDNGDDCYLIRYFGNAKKLTLPESCNGKTYMINKYAFFLVQDVTSIAIGDGVTEILPYAFSNCGAKTITMADSVTILHDYAFYNCYKMESITIGNGVKKLGDCLFSSCYALKNVTISASVTEIGLHIFQTCGNVETITVAEGNPKYISVNNCVIDVANRTLVIGLATSVIPTDGSVTKIGDTAFAGHEMTSIVIPDCIVEIGYGAFRNCIYLESVTIGNGVKIIGDYAFFDCRNLQSIVIPDNVESIGENAFCSCDGLESVTIGSGVVSIGQRAFDSTNLKSATFTNPEGWYVKWWDWHEDDADPVDVSNPENAAEMLRSEYSWNYIWFRK